MWDLWPRPRHSPPDGTEARHGASKRRTARDAHPRRLRNAFAAAAATTVLLRLSIVGGWLVLAIEGRVDILVGVARPRSRPSRGRPPGVRSARRHVHGCSRARDDRGDAAPQAVAAGGCVRLAALSHQARRLLALTDSEGVFPCSTRWSRRFGRRSRSVMMRLSPTRVSWSRRGPGVGSRHRWGSRRKSERRVMGGVVSAVAAASGDVSERAHE